MSLSVPRILPETIDMFVAGSTAAKDELFGSNCVCPIRFSTNSAIALRSYSGFVGRARDVVRSGSSEGGIGVPRTIVVLIVDASNAT